MSSEHTDPTSFLSGLPRKIVASAFTEVFKIPQDMITGNLLYVALLDWGIGLYNIKK